MNLKQALNRKKSRLMKQKLSIKKFIALTEQYVEEELAYIYSKDEVDMLRHSYNMECIVNKLIVL